MVITGGGRGIGRATAVAAARHGFDVVIGFRADELAASAAALECQEMGGQTLTVHVDVTDEASIVDLFEAATTRFGGIDSFINNAGIVNRATTLAEMSAERIREMFEVNAIGAIVAAREAVRRMSTAFGGTGGTIVNVSSVASYLGSPNEYIDYAASKGAIDALTIGLAKEVAHQGIRVNAVRPGLIYTEIHEDSGIENRVDKLSVNVPLGRGGDPTEVASAILWLATDASSYVTGSFIDVSGGR